MSKGTPVRAVEDGRVAKLFTSIAGGLTIYLEDPSGMFTLLEFECLGACDRAPIVMINNEHWHERVRPEDAAKLVDAIKAKGEATFTGCHLRVER